VFPMDRREAWNALKQEKDSINLESVSIMTDFMPIVLTSTKKKIEKNHYNVHVYTVYPYPPDTKNIHPLSQGYKN
jgi:hypothetical protein